MNYIIKPTKKTITLPKRGYYQKGDTSEDIAIISSFLAFNFVGYETKTGVKIDNMLGDYFGDNLLVWIKFFQKCNNLKIDGCIGSITLNKMKEYGLN